MHAGSFGSSSLSTSTRTTLQARGRMQTSAKPSATPALPRRKHHTRHPSSRVEPRAAAPTRAAARVRLRPSSRCGWPRPGRSAQARPHRPSPANAAVTVAIQRASCFVLAPLGPPTHTHARMHARNHCPGRMRAPRSDHGIRTSALARPNQMRFARVRVRGSDSDSDSGGTPQNESYERTLARSAHSGTPISLILSSLSDAVTAESTRSRTASSAADRPSASTCSRRVDTRAAA